MIYDIHIKYQAMKDIKSTVDYIKYEQYNPVASQRFFDGLDAKINGLRLNAGIFAKSIYKDILKYNAAARHVVYKGFAIIYSIHGNLVVIHRVIHGSLIKE
jgi:plasmid stabilization system protein ParE